MVPSMLRNLSPKSFTPRVVSIGPLHHEDENVKEMEGLKRTYLHDLLLRVGSGRLREKTLDTCLGKVKASIDQIRARYIGMRPYSDVQLAQMMLMDGCFILEFCIKHSTDSVNPLLAQSIRLDLLLVENQIPFFVLNYIYESTVLKFEPTTSLTELIYPIQAVSTPFRTHLIRSVEEETTPDHILGFFHKQFQPEFPIAEACLQPSIIHDARELDKVGVSFKPYRDESWPLAMQLEWSRFV